MRANTSRVSFPARLPALLCWLLMLFPLDASRAAPHLPRNSYLRQRVHTARELNRQLRTHPAVLIRYARTFNMAPVLVRMAFQQLRLSYLPADRTLQVHYVLHGEIIGYRVRRIRHGTPVFVLPDGTPVLLRICGNPLRADLKVQTPQTSPPELRLDSERTLAAIEAAPTPELPVPEVRSTVPSLPPATTLTPAPSVETREMPPTEVFGPVPVIAVPPGSHAVSTWPLLGLGALPLLLSSQRTSSLPNGFQELPGVPPAGSLPTPPTGLTPGQQTNQGTQQVQDWVNNNGGTPPGGAGGSGGSLLPPPVETTPQTGGQITPGPPPPTQGTPEPGSLWLSLTVGGAAALVWRKRASSSRQR